MQRKLLHIILFFILVVSTTHAQLYPVQTVHNIIPPYSTKLNDYATSFDVYNGQTIRSAFDGNNAGAFGIALEQKMGTVINDAFNGGVDGIKFQGYQNPTTGEIINFHPIISFNN